MKNYFELGENTKAHFTLGVRANVQTKSSIPIGAKVEINPKGFTLGVKAEIEKKLFNLPQVLINAELYGRCTGPKAEKKRYHQNWEGDLQPLGPMFQHLLIS
jgi:hypothetical protein